MDQGVRGRLGALMQEGHRLGALESYPKVDAEAGETFCAEGQDERRASAEGRRQQEEVAQVVAPRAPSQAGEHGIVGLARA